MIITMLLISIDNHVKAMTTENKLELCDLALNSCERVVNKQNAIIQKQNLLIRDLDKHVNTKNNIIESYESKDDYKWLWIGVAFVAGGYLGVKLNQGSN